MAVFALTSAGYAQTADTKPKQRAIKHTEGAKMENHAANTNTTKNENAGKMKKDGTPDMRHKENKAAAKPKKLKKDGTPDMRYKENKER